MARKIKGPAADMPEKNRAVIYARYSHGPNQRDESIEGQLRECHAVAKKLGLFVIHEYIDRRMSGTNDERPDFQAMLRDGDRRLFDVVITWKNDRFARNRYDSAVYKQRLKKAGVKIIYARENIPDGPEGIILESVLEGMAEWYSANLSENINRGLRENALKCRAVGGTVPLGYKLNNNKNFIVDPETAPLIVEIFTRYAAGESITALITDLNARGYQTARGGTFNRSSLHRILANEKYIGIFRYQDIYIEDGVPALVPPELFAACEKRAAQNVKHKRDQQLGLRAAQPAAGFAPDFLLTGRAWCGYCGGPLAGMSGTSKTGAKHYYYACHNKRRKKCSCEKKPIKKELLENIVINYVIKNVLADTAIINNIVDRCLEIQLKEIDQAPAAGLKNQLKEVQKSIKNLMAAIEAGIITPTTKSRLVELEVQQAALETGIAAAQITPPKFTREQLLFIFEKYRGGDLGDLAFCREIINTFVSAVYVYNDHLTVTFNFTADGAAAVHELNLAELGASSVSSAVVCSPNAALTPPHAARANPGINIFYIPDGFAVSVLFSGLPAGLM